MSIADKKSSMCKGSRVEGMNHLFSRNIRKNHCDYMRGSLREMAR
jgi:hypothetical protein